MDPTQVAKQMIDFQKTAFQNFFNAVSMYQDLTSRVTHLAINQIPGLPDEGKETYTFWMELYKKGREDFKNAVVDVYDKMAEECCSDPGKGRKSGSKANA